MARELDRQRQGNPGRPVISESVFTWLEEAWLSASVDLGEVVIYGTHEPITALLRDAAFIVIVGLSLAFALLMVVLAKKSDWI